MDKEKRLPRRILDWVGYAGTLWWFLQTLVWVAVGALTFLKGLSANIPYPYLIATTIVAAGGVVYLLNQSAVFFRRWREGYAYGLSYAGPLIGYNPDQVNGILQVGIVIRNVTGRPLRYTVKRFHVVVGSTTIANPSFTTVGGFISRGETRQYFYPPFTKAQVEKFIGKAGEQGEISFEILYGHPDGPNVRKLEMTLALTLNLLAHDRFGVRDLIVTESDTRT